MPAVAPERIVQAILDGIADAGYVGTLASPKRRNPRRFIITGQNAPQVLSIYSWTLTFGGRPSLKNEYRIQMTGVTSPLEIATDGPTLLIGYEPDLNLFAGFDLHRHRTFTTGSPSVQVDIGELQRAETDGLSFHRKGNDEIAVGIRPDMLIAYAMNATVLHRYGREANILSLLTKAVSEIRLPQQALEPLPAERRRFITEVSRLSREAGFRQQVLFAYGNRCAVTRVQLHLVDAAHILPVGAPGSADHVRNGLALSPTYHRAFDAGLIYLDEQFRMQIYDGNLQALQHLRLAGGLESFKAPLGQIFLPPDPAQRPSPDFIRRANRFRQIAT
ncbi:MAG: HNH endonuclease [Candidatus Binataceae bacterium]|nr:HNH endonuclease [Candidatus Binataceae bacterium]